jgi:biopolymer transport protein ExbD
MRKRRRSEDLAEMSMTPMIDMVFLLLVFFLVTSKPMKPEADLGLKLPGTVAQEEAVDIPDEQRIEVKEGGRVLLNDMPVGEPGDGELPLLLATLVRFKESAVANRSEALVTLAVENEVPHQRIADVMNVCARAGIDGVTFATGDEEEAF